MATKTDVNSAALDYAKALSDMYTKVVDAAVSAQARNVAFAQSMFERSVEELKKQTETARDVAQTATQQAQKQQTALETLAQQSAAAYKEYLDGMMSFYAKGLEVVQQTAQTAQTTQAAK